MYRGVFFVLSVILPVGCSGPAGEEAGVLDAGERVAVIGESGDYSRVKTGDGREVYVRSTLLKQKSDAGELNVADDDYTHEVTAPATVFTKGPPAKEKIEVDARTQDQIAVEEMQLNGVFLTERTKQRVIAPMNSQPTHNGELCWPALTCKNPRCPGRGNPYLFINPNPGSDVVCPACLKIRNVDTESDEDRMRYRGYVETYMLPETLRRMKELNRERRRAMSRY
jgi:hypothetical protein